MKVAVGKVVDYDASRVREALRSLLVSLGFPADRPMSGLVRPGDRVFIKPNWVAHEYRRSCQNAARGEIYSVITHPEVIRAVADMVAEALAGRGSIVVGDNPSIDADFEKLMELTGIRDLEGRYDVPCRVLDLRPLVCTDLRDYGKKRRMKRQPGDPAGETLVDLGERSLLYGVNPLLFRGVFDSRWETVLHHLGRRQQYAFSSSVVNADLYISIPKLKTHHKVGTTLNLKGLVGANSVKNYLVHWREGFPAMGGDAYPDFHAWLADRFATVKNRGAWHGNDTIWRMVVDLYTVLEERVARTFSVVDGILGGERNGPFCPQAKRSGVLIAGQDLLAVDCVATRLMDLDVKAIPYLDFLLKKKNRNLDQIEVVSRDFPGEDFFSSERRYLGFVPPDHWPKLAVGSSGKEE